MAILAADDLTTLRAEVAADQGVIAHTKPQINAAFQAIENWYEANRASLGTAIEAAAPGVFTAAQKRRLGKYWLRLKFQTGG